MPGNLVLDLASQVLGEFFGHVSPFIGAHSIIRANTVSLLARNVKTCAI